MTTRNASRLNLSNTMVTAVSAFLSVAMTSSALADEIGYFPWPPVQCDGCHPFEWLPAELDESTSRSWVALDEYGAANPGVEPTINFLQGPSSATRSFYQVQVHGFWAGHSQHQQAGDNPAAWEFSIPGNPTLEEIGLPALPTVVFASGLPFVGELELESVQYFGIENWALASTKGDIYSEVLPAQPDVEEVSGDFVLPDYAAERGWYQEMNVAWPEEDGAVSFINKKNVNHARIELNPIRYNPSNGSIHVARTIACAVRHEGEPASTLTLNAATAQALDAEILNFGDLVNRGIAVPAQAPNRNYLIVLREDFYEEVQPLAELKRQRGFNVEYRFISNSTSASQVKNHILDWYNSLATAGDAYVLLTGDSNIIGHMTTTNPNTNGNYKTSDMLYACLFNANDPVCSVGRIPAENEAECAVMIQKIVAYQDDPGLDPNFYETATIAAHAGENAYLNCADEIITSTSYDRQRTFIDRSADMPEGQTEGVLADVEDVNVGLVLYRGHGAAKRWANWDFDHDPLRALDVDTLQNTDYHPVVISAACSNSNMSSQPECIAVRWMETEFGASAHIGAMAGSRRQANNVFSIELMERFQRNWRGAIGDAMRDSLCETMFQKNFSASSVWNFEVYQLLGDPSMRVWNSAPTPLQMSAPEEVALNEEFTIQVTDLNGLPIEGAVVVASDHTNVHASAYTDSNGTATLTVRDCLKPVISLRAWTPMENTIDARSMLALEAFTPGDVNGDGTVNGADLGMLLSAWGTSNPAADLNGDGVVDGADLGLVLASW